MQRACNTQVIEDYVEHKLLEFFDSVICHSFKSIVACGLVALSLASEHATALTPDEIMHMFAASGVYIKMFPWPPPFTMIGRQGYVVALKITLSRG
jgi:hypothetical protein